MKHVAIAIAGEPPLEVRQSHGSYHPWFNRLLEEHSGIALDYFDARVSHMSEEPLKADAIIISGSPSSVTEPEPWLPGLIQLAKRAIESQVPILGVCFGHQVLGAALGAKVRRNPQGWELGTYAIETLSDDPLFRQCPPTFHANLSHQDDIDPATLPSEVSIIAQSARCPVQAFALGDRVRGVQYHPEFTGETTKAFLRSRWDVVAEDAESRHKPEEHPARYVDSIVDCRHGEQTLSNFVEAFVLNL